MNMDDKVTFFDQHGKEFTAKTIYIIGPMRGKTYYNFPAFDKKRDELKREGWNVLSPADLDRKVGFDGCDLPLATNWNEIPAGFNMLECVRRDIRAILSLRPGIDAVYVLPGKRGAGSEAELKLAIWMHLDIYFSEECTCGEAGVFDDDNHIPDATKMVQDNGPTYNGNPAMKCASELLREAERLVCSERNASYGSPDEDFTRTAAMWTGYLQDLLRAPLKSSNVSWMMMMVKASRSRHDEKRDHFADAAGYAACGWKCVEKYATEQT